MSWSIDPPVRIGDLTLAAIVECRTSARSLCGALIATGEKRPVLILVQRGGEASGFDLNGKAMSAEEISRDYPGAIEGLREWRAE